jgi:hypothetical protein
MAKYACKQRGYRLSFGDSGLTFNGKGSILFSHKNPDIETDDPKIMHFIEESRAFLNNTIMRIPTPEEVAELQRIEKAANTLAVLQDMVKRPGVSMDFRAMKKPELNQIADDLNLDFNGLANEQLIAKLEVMVYGEVQSKPVANKPKEKKKDE